jgi:hypothetical protein
MWGRAIDGSEKVRFEGQEEVLTLALSVQH